MAESKNSELIGKVERGELDEVLTVALDEANKYENRGLTIGDLRKHVIENLREKETGQNQS